MNCCLGLRRARSIVVVGASGLIADRAVIGSGGPAVFVDEAAEQSTRFDSSIGVAYGLEGNQIHVEGNRPAHIIDDEVSPIQQKSGLERNMQRCGPFTPTVCKS